MSDPYETAKNRLRLSDRDLITELGYCPDCYELAHEANCVSDEEAEDEEAEDEY